MATDLRWCKITVSGLLQFDGPDARAFLQGQLTNNVQALSAARSQYSGYCTAKGRLLACLLLSGLLSWFNFSVVRWRLRPPAAWR